MYMPSDDRHSSNLGELTDMVKEVKCVCPTLRIAQDSLIGHLLYERMQLVSIS